jgi:hypothetical protein
MARSLDVDVLEFEGDNALKSANDAFVVCVATSHAGPLSAQ